MPLPYGIFIAKRIQQIADKIKKPVYALFLVLTAAFDHVKRNWLFKTIDRRLPNHADRTLIKLIEALHSYTTTAISEAPDHIFLLTAGV